MIDKIEKFINHAEQLFTSMSGIIYGIWMADIMFDALEESDDVPAEPLMAYEQQLLDLRDRLFAAYRESATTTGVVIEVNPDRRS